jgi:dTDP-4-amino-4,6-dideoxygalactose transaminase
VYGNVCDVENIETIAKKYGLRVIYDAAHAFGVKYKGQGIANFGDASMFSFHATKVYNTIEGGAVCYHAKKLGNKLQQLRDFGIENTETVDAIGTNAKMNEFAAAMGLCNLRHVDREIAKRKKVVECYREQLYGLKGLKLPIVQRDVTPNYSYFPIIINEKEFGATRNEVFETLERNGIHARKYFYPLTNSFNCFHGQFDVSLTPVALHISKRVITLPLYADLDLETVKRICEILKSFQI